MNSLNSIIIEGNLTRNPELKNVSNGVKVCTLPIAVNRTSKAQDGTKQDEVSYFEVETFGTLAEVCTKWCPKGRGVRVVGRLKQYRWADTDGKQHSRVKVIAEHVEFKPYFKKEDGEEAAVKDKGPDSAYAGNPAPTKKEKLQMLAEAAQAAQSEQEVPEPAEEVAF